MNKDIFMGVLVFLFLVCFIMVFIQIQVKSTQQTNEWCDEEYGEGNWIFEDITGTDRSKETTGRFYLGQVWGCVEKEVGDLK